MEVLGIVLILLAILIIVVVARAAFLSPTSAQTASVQLDESSRAEKYGMELSKLIQKETISSRFEPDRTKFLEFHELL